MSAKAESPSPPSPKRARRKVARRSGKWTGPTALGDVLAKTEIAKANTEVDNAPIDMEAWRAVVGPRIAEKSSPHHLDPDGVLQVRVATSVWAQELSLLSTSIIKRLRALGLRVTFLRFTVGRIHKSLRTTGRVIRRIVPPPVQLPDDITAEMMRVEDVELREVLMQAAAASLAEFDRDMRDRQAKKKAAGKQAEALQTSVSQDRPSDRSRSSKDGIVQDRSARDQKRTGRGA